MEQQEKFLLTQEGVDKLNEELRELIDIKRPEIIKAIQEAREQGDLSENADYDAAKNAQAELEGRIKEIQNILNHVEVIKEVAGNSKKVKVGSKVKIYDYSDKQSYVYEIVGEVESDPDNNKISNESPLAHAILNKTPGTTVEVYTIDEPYKVKIESIEN